MNIFLIRDIYQNTGLKRGVNLQETDYKKLNSRLWNSVLLGSPCSSLPSFEMVAQCSDLCELSYTIAL